MKKKKRIDELENEIDVLKADMAELQHDVKVLYARVLEDRTLIVEMRKEKEWHYAVPMDSTGTPEDIYKVTCNKEA